MATQMVKITAKEPIVKLVYIYPEAWMELKCNRLQTIAMQ